MLCLMILTLFAAASPAAAAPALKPGSTSGDVWDLQYRLYSAGYFDQKLDGQYGTQTQAAVMGFQQAYGLPADGIAGGQTWRMLRKHSLNLNEMDIMARVIFSEARGESYTGQVAVGAVVMNRIQSAEFPDNIHDVVFQAGAFTSVDDGQYWLTPDRSAYLAALDAVRGWDPSNGSLFYFNPLTATSKWIWSRPQNITIGNHIFTN
ncbi:cell wall hydrolase [Paenibacillus sp. NFR01]|uniref:cell wall hydrolase n=1 Tax=Paenibacillus sp. NFR01 TaxID=1566279 RepID=UPI0020C890C6|nr:cell wall hydrolase [Paenibacillus sp. NFR01]